MLYLDASVLVKRYMEERGSSAVRQRCRVEQRIFTSALSFAEVHAALARKLQRGQVDRSQWLTARDLFSNDWRNSLIALELDSETLNAVPDLVERFPLRAGDAVHLATSLWLSNRIQAGAQLALGDSELQFGVSDKSLARIAAQCGLAVFDPEAD